MEGMAGPRSKTGNIQDEPRTQKAGKVALCQKDTEANKKVLPLARDEIN